MLYDGAVTITFDELTEQNTGLIESVDGVPDDSWNGKTIQVNIGDFEYEAVSDYGDLIYSDGDDFINVTINPPEEEEPGYISIISTPTLVPEGSQDFKLTLLD